jgi:hypothetical protein
MAGAGENEDSSEPGSSTSPNRGGSDQTSTFTDGVSDAQTNRDIRNFLPHHYFDFVAGTSTSGYAI